MSDNKYPFEVQTRRWNGALRTFDTMKEAMEDAKDPEVCKVSFPLETGERVRLVREEDETDFYYQPILPE